MKPEKTTKRKDMTTGVIFVIKNADKVTWACIGKQAQEFAETLSGEQWDAISEKTWKVGYVKYDYYLNKEKVGEIAFMRRERV